MYHVCVLSVRVLCMRWPMPARYDRLCKDMIGLAVLPTVDPYPAPELGGFTPLLPQDTTTRT